MLTPEQIEEMDKVTGWGNVPNVPVGDVATPSPLAKKSRADEIRELIQKNNPVDLGDKVSEIATNTRTEYQKTKVDAELRQEAGQQGALSTGFQVAGAAAKAGMTTLFAPLTASIGAGIDSVTALVRKGREIQRSNDDAAIAAGTLKPEEALSRKPDFEDTLMATAEDFYDSAVASRATQKQRTPGQKDIIDLYQESSPATKANLGAVTDIGEAALNVVGGKVAKDVTKKVGAKVFDKALGVKIKMDMGLPNIRKNIVDKQKTKELDSLFKKKTISNGADEATRKGVDLKKELMDDDVYKGMRVEGGQVNVDDAVATVEDRIDKAMDVKREVLPELDRFLASTPKQTLFDDAIKDIKGTLPPADEADLIAKIKKQVDALPDDLKPSEIDSYRAKFRKAGRDAKGLQKSDSEYAALENAFRNRVFKMTDDLSFEGGKFKELNDFIRKNIIVKDFLEKKVKNSAIKSGRLGVMTGRIVGAIAGSGSGPLAAILASEGGGFLAKVLADSSLGNSLKMKLIRSATNDPKIIEEAGKLLQGAKNYKVPQLPSKGAGTSRGPAIKVAPEADAGTFDFTGKTPGVTPATKPK